MATEARTAIYDGLPVPKDGFFAMPTRPGMGFDLTRDKLKDVLENHAS